MSVEALNSMDKKQQFQQELLTIIKKELMNEGEQAEGIEDLLFTSFAIYEKFAKTLKKNDPARVAGCSKALNLGINTPA